METSIRRLQQETPQNALSAQGNPTVRAVFEQFYCHLREGAAVHLMQDDKFLQEFRTERDLKAITELGIHRPAPAQSKPTTKNITPTSANS